LEHVTATTIVAATYDDEWWTLRIASPGNEPFGMANFYSMIEGELYDGWPEAEKPSFAEFLAESYCGVGRGCWPSADIRDLADCALDDAIPQFVERQAKELLSALVLAEVRHSPSEVREALCGPFDDEVLGRPIGNLPLVLKALGVDALDPDVEWDETIIGSRHHPEEREGDKVEEHGDAGGSSETESTEGVLFKGAHATYREASVQEGPQLSRFAQAIATRLGYELVGESTFLREIFGIAEGPKAAPKEEFAAAFRSLGFDTLGSFVCDKFPGIQILGAADPEGACFGVHMLSSVGVSVVEFTTRFDDGTWLSTTNNEGAQSVPGKAVVYLDSDAATLLAAHRKAIGKAKGEGRRPKDHAAMLVELAKFIDAYLCQE